MATGDVSRTKFATGTNIADGDWSSPLVAAVVGKKIRVTGLSCSVLTTAGVLSLKSSGGSTIFQLHLALGTPFDVFMPVGICETVAGEALVPSNGTGVDSFVNVSYQEVDV